MSNEVKKIKPVMSEGRDKDLYSFLNLMLNEVRTHSPFFGVLASEMWIAGPSKSVPTIGVSPKGVVVYNEEYMRGLTPGERLGVLIHESLHVALEFWDIFPKGYNHKIANWAHDYSINDIIINSLSNLTYTRQSGQVVHLKISLPKGGLYDAKYNNWSTEEVYRHLLEGITEKAKGYSQKLSGGGNANESENNKELRKSLIKGGTLVNEKKKEIDAQSQKLQEIDALNRQVFEDLKSASGLEFEYKNELQGNEEEPEPEQGPQEPGESQDKTDGQGQEPGQQADQSDGQSQEADQGAEPSNDAGGENGPQDPREGSEGGSPSNDGMQGKKDDLSEKIKDAFRDYMGKEKERIEEQASGNSNNTTTREDHLQELSDEIDKIAKDYVDDVTNEADKGNPSDDGKEGPDDGQPGEPGEGEPGEPGEPGEGEPGQDGDPQPGEGQPGEGQPGEPGDGQPGEGQPGQSQPGQGQPGQGQPGGGMTEGQALEDVVDSLESAIDEISNSLGGKEGGVKGLDKNMASGKDMIEQGALEKAMEDMRKDIGAGELDGDVDMDCSEIPGNPYSNETPEETTQRHRETMSRAVREDMMSGGQGIGSLPAWARVNIEGVINPPMRFNQLIKRFIGRLGTPNKRSFAIRNKRNTFQANTMIRPGVKSNSELVYILMDSSGSMMNGADFDNLRSALGLINNLTKSKGLEVCVVQGDAAVTRVMTSKEALDEIRANKFEIVGSGGSDFRPSFEYIWKDMRERNSRGNAIIVFTDGGIYVPDEVPRYINQQVLWVTNKGQHAPTEKYGDHVVMEDLGR